MPLHDLKCNDCGKTSEWLVRAQDLNTAGMLKDFECPFCGNTQAGYSKILSVGTTFQLKGNGWYKDGYSSNPTVKTNPSGDS